MVSTDYHLDCWYQLLFGYSVLTITCMVGTDYNSIGTDATFKHNLASMSFESAAALRAAIDTAYEKICNSIRDGTLADTIPCMRPIFVSALYSMLLI